MDILSKLRILFWGLIVGLWGLFMYQYMTNDLSLPQIHLSKNPFTGNPLEERIIKKQAPPGIYTPRVTFTQPQASTAAPQGSFVKPLGGADIREIVSKDIVPEHSNQEKASMHPRVATTVTYLETPKGFSMKETRNFVVYEEGPAVSDELRNTLEDLHGNIMLDLVAFSPWTRENKVFIFYAQKPETYRSMTGRPTWSGGSASLSERKIYLYKSEEAFGILSHELTHMYFDSFFTTANPSPLWLSEGMATYIQSERGYSTPNWLAQNLKLLQKGSGFKLNDLMRIENLQGADADNVRLWYAQSYSLVRFLLKIKAGDAFYVFCKGVRDGKPVAQSLYQAYGMPYNKLSSLEYAWRYDLKTGKLATAN
ncbi:MAG TPA: hypothetical protein DCL44_01395 [Elusimicrobia bacterium]|nr:hypothetical protein [Elusimicrobiota bacterium]